MLNAGLPRKRVISQAVVRDPAGRVLLCELTYKSEWDLPGGVVEPMESPATGLSRELREELGIDMAVGELLTVNWLPAWRGWDDACLLVFDGGTLPAGATDTMALQPAEIRAVHWCTSGDVRARATAATVRLLEALARPERRGCYLEDGSPPPGL
jgi:ADP-ribose pyrophosphatase YjhB (NUDIX family)